MPMTGLLQREPYIFLRCIVGLECHFWAICSIEGSFVALGKGLTTLGGVRRPCRLIINVFLKLTFSDTFC